MASDIPQNGLREPEVSQNSTVLPFIMKTINIIKQPVDTLGKTSQVPQTSDLRILQQKTICESRKILKKAGFTNEESTVKNGEMFIMNAVSQCYCQMG